MKQYYLTFTYLNNVEYGGILFTVHSYLLRDLFLTSPKMIESTLFNVSKHLTLEVLDNAFTQKTDSQDTVKSLKVTRAAPAGEGLLSAVFRIHAKGQKYEANFVVKGLVKDEVLRKSLDCTKYFATEAEFFTNILPILSELQKNSGATESIQRHIPKCYSCYIDGENDFILIEDLAETGCSSLPRFATQNERCKILRVLAHFHAVSMALRIKKPYIFNKIADRIPEIYYSSAKRNFYTPYLHEAIKIDRDVLEEYFDSESIYLKKFNEIVRNDAFGQLSTSATTRGEQPVICHGDCWCPNFLISEERTVIIDFQLVRCCSPASDLSYFILMNECMSKNDFFNAVDIYYSALDYYLDDMGLSLSKELPLPTLLEELKIFGRYGFFASLTSIPLLAGERCDVLKSIKDKFPGKETVPLECLWELKPILNPDDKLRLINTVRVAVDAGLI